jgi:hypothetical protein
MEPFNFIMLWHLKKSVTVRAIKVHLPAVETEKETYVKAWAVSSDAGYNHADMLECRGHRVLLPYLFTIT